MSDGGDIIRNIPVKCLLVSIVIAVLNSAGHAMAAEPLRILSLAPAATEIIFDLGLGGSVVGVTEYCNWPPEAKSKDNIGDMMRVNMEVLISMRPDLVVVSNMNEHLKEQIEALGYKVAVVYQDSFEQICVSMLRVGEACGVPDAAQKRVEEIREVVRGLSAGFAGQRDKRVLIVVGRDADDASFKKVYVAGLRSFYEELLEDAGASNAFTEDLPYAALSLEGLLRLDPDIIIELVGEHGMTGADSRSILAQWKNLTDLRAARDGNVAVIRGDFTLRAGPRYPLILESFAKIIHEGVREIEE
ncbi:MAG: helical backbone metal receptor [Synergistaceae bacterium]|jgi:iron complex transport system substrate-binding protein|nr:helical backbone metal receptor [Synergistaceae bacterium]